MWDNLVGNIGELEVQTTWNYTPSDPYAISIRFHVSQGFDDIEWVFSRESLHSALIDRFGGCADVVWIVEDHIARLLVSSPEGKAVILFNREQVEKFFSKTLDTVPLGEETIDIDSAISRIFEESI